MDTFIIGKYLEAQKHYYYPGVREQFRFPPAKRDITEELPLMIEIEQEERVTVRERRSKETGFLGVSLLHRLHKLYKFNVMHLVPLNLVKRRFEHLLSNSLLNTKQLQRALEKVPWPQGTTHSCSFRNIKHLLIYKLFFTTWTLFYSFLPTNLHQDKIIIFNIIFQQLYSKPS